MKLEWKESLETSALDAPLRQALADFYTAFEALPDEPYTFNPHYIRTLVNNLIKEAIAREDAPVMWWEVTLNLAQKWAADRGDLGADTLKAIAALQTLLPEHFQHDDSEVTLQEVTQSTVNGIIMLSETLTPPDRFSVAPNANSMAQAHFNQHAWFRAIYAGKMPIGFVMLSINLEEPDFYVWRLMIAEPYQRRGYGRKAMEAIIAHVRTLPGATELILSYVEGPGSPADFYKKIGFVPTGEVDHGEIYAKIDL